AIQLHGLGHNLNKNYPAAIAAYHESLKIYRSISPESDSVSNVLNDLAEAERANKDYPAAERDYRTALRIAKKKHLPYRIAEQIGNSATLALDRKQWIEAETLAREALALAEEIYQQEYIALDCHRIAKALLKQNRNLEEAISLSRRAIEIFTRLRQRDNLQETQETLAEIEKALDKK
ncbi:MAG: tetratricopeptide repeat protein, partial [Anaerolineae bacterium]|nr:tetratricopeptide repeat protein [Anaerolineae bacterium]